MSFLFTNKILVTGANGFVGSALCEKLSASKVQFLRVARSNSRVSEDTLQTTTYKDINYDADWVNVLQGIGTIIHLAARVHIMDDRAENPLQEFLEVNLHGTMNLAKQAAEAGVKRFVYISSIKVNGEFTNKEPFSELDMPNPQDDYAISKMEAEQALLNLAKDTGMEVVIIRPPLVYGPGVKANFLSLLSVAKRSIPLPFDSIRNQRSMIYIDNLIDAITLCARHPGAAGNTYLVSDVGTVSTAGLIRRVANALGAPCLVFPLPLFVLKAIARFLGKQSVMDRLTQSLVVDSSKIHQELGWKPPCTMQKGLQETADWFLRNEKR